MLNYLFPKDQLTGKRRVSPVGCIATLIVALFGFACIGAWFTWLYSTNIVRLAEPAHAVNVPTATAQPQPTLLIVVTSAPLFTPTPSVMPTPTRTVPPVAATMTAQAVAKWTPTRTPTRSVTASTTITWTVTPVVVNGRTIYDAPKAIKDWVVRNWIETQKWWDEHLFDRQYLIDHMHKYYAEPALSLRRKYLKADIENNLDAVFPSSLDKLAGEPIVQGFSPDGKSAYIQMFYKPGQLYYYDLKGNPIYWDTRTYTLTTVNKMVFSSSDQRWKISLILLRMNADTGEILTQQEDKEYKE